MSRRRTAAVLAGLASGLLAAGCGGRSDEDQVRDALARFETATKNGDYKTLCDDVLAKQLLASMRAHDLPCRLALQHGLGGVLQPSISVEKIKLRGDTALAQVTSTAVGQRPSHDTMRLVRQDGDWRVAALSGAQPPAPPRNLEGKPE